jgi:hypothetical protein
MLDAPPSHLFISEEPMPPPNRRLEYLLICLMTLAAVGCDRSPERRGHESSIAHAPCKLEVDSPADGEVDAVFDVVYEDGRPVRASGDFGEGGEMASCVSLGYEGGQLASKTVHQGKCQEEAPPDTTSTLERVEGSNLVALTFPGGELTYHYVAMPDDFTFLLTRTAYNLGPQEISDVEVADGRFQSLTLPEPEPVGAEGGGSTGPHTLEAIYRGGELIRVSEKNADGDEVGHVSFHYREGRPVKVERRLRTMSEGQTEEVHLRYDCEG